MFLSSLSLSLYVSGKSQPGCECAANKQTPRRLLIDHTDKQLTSEDDEWTVTIDKKDRGGTRKCYGECRCYDGEITLDYICYEKYMLDKYYRGKVMTPQGIPIRSVWGVQAQRINNCHPPPLSEKKYLHDFTTNKQKNTHR